MTDSDVLGRAAKALRQAHTGEREGSGFTRARIMNALHRERRRRILRWTIVSPIASLLLVGSAWAQSAGKWPEIWKAVASVFVAAPSTEPAPPAPSPKRSGRSNAPPAELDVAPDAAIDAVPEPPPAIEPRVLPRAAEPALTERPRSKRRSAARASPKPAATSGDEKDEPAPEPAPDRELRRFRAAHDLHFSGRSPREAIEAYAEYLREFPNGRFVPEARYNIALDQIKLGNDEAAREALAPFAAGKFGGYRQKEARQLLDALQRDQPSSPLKK